MPRVRRAGSLNRTCAVHAFRATIVLRGAMAAKRGSDAQRWGGRRLPTSLCILSSDLPQARLRRDEDVQSCAPIKRAGDRAWGISLREGRRQRTSETDSGHKGVKQRTYIYMYMHLFMCTYLAMCTATALQRLLLCRTNCYFKLLLGASSC